MANIVYTPKTWKNYPDTSTPIMADDLNRIETAVGKMASVFQSQTDISKTITQFILSSINALHPEYTVNEFSETVETEADTTMACHVDLNTYNPESSDGLLITADGILISPTGYTTAVESNAAVIRFGTSAGLAVGQTVDFYVYHKPQTGGISVGQSIAITTGTSDSIEGISTEIEEEETT